VTRDDGDERYADERRFHDELVNEGRERSADRFYAINKSSWTCYERLLLEEAERARRRGQGRILEYGCGAGAYSSIALAAAGYEAISVDLSEASIRVARDRAAQRFPQVPVEYRVMNAEALEFENGFFELVCGNGILHHLDLERAYTEVARVLAPGGTALFTEPLGHNPLINLYRRLTPRQRTHDEHPLRLADLERARRYFGEVDAWYFHVFAMAAVPFRRTPAFARILSALDRLDRRLLDTVVGSRRYAWLVVIRLGDPRPGGRLGVEAASSE
jgi:SAM-dependent methyltransferase